MKVVSRVPSEHPGGVWLTYLLTVALILTLGGCHQSNNSSNSTSSATASSSAAAAPSSTVASTTAAPSTEPSNGGCDANATCGSGGQFTGPGGRPGGQGCVPGVGCGSSGQFAGPGGVPGGTGCLPGIGCDSGGSVAPPLSRGGGGGGTLTPTPSLADEFAEIKKTESQLLTANASWDAPKTLKVEKTQRIGLQIGQSKALSDKINQLIPNASQSPVGPLKVGPLMRARLEADPDDADVTPSQSVDYSTASSPELLWTWMVRPKRPTDALVLTAHLEVPLEGSSNVLPTDIPLQIRVDSTLGFRLGQIFTNWKTLTAIGAALLAGGTWCFRWWTIRRRGLRAVKCPKCGTRQNISVDESTVNCWNCKKVSTVPGRRRARTGDAQTTSSPAADTHKAASIADEQH
jgi:hypothetical protein